MDETSNDNDPNEGDNLGDNDIAFTFKLFASDANGNPLTDDNGDYVSATEITEEPETSAHYVVLAIDENGDPLEVQPTGTVDVAFTNNGTTSNGD